MGSRSRLTALAALAGACCIQARGEERAPAPWTFHYAATGAFASTIDLGEAPITRDRVVVFYMHNFGRYPYVDVDTGTEHNGVVPQRTDMTAHLLEVQADVARAIPDPRWDGFAVIDYEAWTPWWAHLTDRYKDESRAIVRAIHPEWSASQVENRARLRFEEAARSFMLRTLNTCKQVRPRAKWGFWSYPKQEFRDDDAQWLWDAQTAFYPSVYMQMQGVPDHHEPGLGQAYASAFVRNRLVARVRYARELAGARPVAAFAWPRYGHTNPNEWLRLRPLTGSDLAMMLGGPRLFGADGVILWDNLPQASLAGVFQGYFNSRLGPAIERAHSDALDEASGRLRQDINRDGIVDASDLGLVLLALEPYSLDADLNLDGAVDVSDVVLLLAAIGRTG